MTTKVNTSTTTPTELAARLTEIATIVEAAHVDPVLLEVHHRGKVTVQCSRAVDVDAVMALLDDAPARYETPNLYTRWGTFDEVISVQVYGPPHAKTCYCGAPCDHKAGA